MIGNGFFVKDPLLPRENINSVTSNVVVAVVVILTTGANVIKHIYN
jgi:hypothetical protein